MTPPKVDVGILTIREDEFRAVLSAFPDEAGIHRGQREYTLRYASAGGSARYTLAIFRAIEQGNGEAQDAARDLLEDLAPTLLLVVGIAGGLPSDDVTLGDVVLSTRINDYSVEARKTNASTTYSLSGGPIAKKLAASVANLAGREKELGDWAASLPPRPAVAWEQAGQLYGPDDWQTEVREKLEYHFGKDAERRAPTFLAGPIASSDRLVKDPLVLFPWIETARNLLAVEMESGGVYRAGRDRCPVLAIRGLSDIVGLKRSEHWTKFACGSAAAFTRAFLRTRPTPPLSGDGLVGSTEDQNDPPPVDKLYSNLVPLVDFPSTIFVGRALASNKKDAWALLKNPSQERPPGSWILHERKVYSFTNPAESRLKTIIEPGTTTSFLSIQWSESRDPETQKLFVQLLGAALQDDLGAKGVRFWFDDWVFAFTGRVDEPPRKYKYQNLRQRSTITVVSHYLPPPSKDGRVYPYLRHLAFSYRFRNFDGTFYLEVNPTYRFTSDGKNKARFHKSYLSGIKRLERNRAVLSQVLLWCELLCEHKPGNRSILGFGKSLSFDVEQNSIDEALSLAPEVDGSDESEYRKHARADADSQHQ